MTDLEELIETANKLCEKFDRMAAQEKSFSLNICMQFEEMSWSMLRMSNEIKEIKEYIG